MPMVVPVVAGAWAMAAAGTALAAGATIAAGLSMVGGFFTLVGGLAGDKDAVRLGGMLGLAGGAAGALGGGTGASTTNAAGEAAAEGATATAGNTVADNIGTTAVDDMVGPPAELAGNSSSLSPGDVGIGTGGGADGGSGLIREAAGLAGDAPGMADLNAMGDVGMGVDRATDVARMGGTSLAGDQTKSALFSDAGYGDRMSGEATRIFDEGVQSSADSKWGSLSEMFGGAEKWMKENPNLVKFGGGIVKGAMDYLGDRQQIKDRMNAEKSYRDWVRQRYSDSVRNLVIPAPIGGPPATGGIIAGQRG